MGEPRSEQEAPQFMRTTSKQVFLREATGLLREFSLLDSTYMGLSVLNVLVDIPSVYLSITFLSPEAEFASAFFVYLGFVVPTCTRNQNSNSVPRGVMVDSAPTTTQQCQLCGQSTLWIWPLRISGIFLRQLFFRACPRFGHEDRRSSSLGFRGLPRT
jgi:hypothetical protein